MNKSSQYNQQHTEPKQCKSKVEELRIHYVFTYLRILSLETGHCNIWIDTATGKLWQLYAREKFSDCPKKLYISESREISKLHETISF